MFSRLTVIAAFCMLLTLPAQGTNLYPLNDVPLTDAAQKARAGDTAGALATARSAAPSGTKDFFLGMMAFKNGKWTEAAEALGSAETKFPLLIDYTLFHRAGALHQLGKEDEAVAALRRLYKEAPESSLLRSAELLEADALYAKKDLAAALTAYVKFVEKYASGNDAITALYNSALCKEEMGDKPAATVTYRNVWLNNPASPFATKADAALRRLASEGVKMETFSPEELFRRATRLYDLKSYQSTIDTLANIPKKDLPADLANRIALKTGQALLRSRHYSQAEQTLAALVASNLKADLRDEAMYNLARSLDKQGKYAEAFPKYMALAEASPPSPLADDALFDAALIKKYEGKEAESIALMEKLTQVFPASPLKNRCRWEISWSRYLLKDYKNAADGFAKLREVEDYREKSLYWHARAAEAAGDKEGAQASLTALLKDFPLGFYALQHKKEKGIPENLQPLPENPSAFFPVPQGYERVKVLIALGLQEEAAKELAAAKKKNGKKPNGTAALGRLYLEMGNYNGLTALYRGEKLSRLDRDNLQAWVGTYPLAYNNFVAEIAPAHNVPQPLVLSVIKAESSFLPTAKSPVGAIGLMQLMPATAKAIEADNATTSALVDPRTNIRLGIRHLKDVVALFKGNTTLAVAAYNAGAGNVNKWRKNFGHLPEMEFIENIPFPETREYVKKVMAGAELYSRLYTFKEESSRKFQGYTAVSSAR